MSTALFQALVSGLAVGGVYALIALGFSITYTTTRTLNFAQGEMVTAGIFVWIGTLLWLLNRPLSVTATFADAPLWLLIAAALGATLLMGVLGALLYLLAIRPFAGKAGMSWVVSTIGFGIILQSTGLAVWGAGTFVVPSPFGDQLIRVMGAGVRPQELLVFFTSLVVMVGFDWTIRHTMLGKVMRAVAQNKQVASLMGINVPYVMMGAFFLSSALAGLSGILIAPIATASMFMGFAFGLKGFCAAMIGGLSNARGCAAGGFMLGLLEAYVNLWQAQWREIVVFGLVILVLAFRPSGLFGKTLVEKT